MSVEILKFIYDRSKRIVVFRPVNIFHFVLFLVPQLAVQGVAVLHNFAGDTYDSIKCWDAHFKEHLFGIG